MRGVLLDTVDRRNLIRPGDAQAQILQDPVFHGEDPAVHREFLAGFPGILHGGRVADIGHLFDHVQLA